MKQQISKPQGKLGVLIVGMNGAVATTFIAGTMAVRKGMGVPVGSLTQMGTIRIGRRIENNFPKIKDFLPLYELDQLVFGGWDINDESALDGTKTAEVLNEKDINKVADELATLRPMKAVFDKEFVKKLDGNWVKKANTKMEKIPVVVAGLFWEKFI